MPRYSCVPIGLGLDSRRETYEHMGGADHVVVNGPSNVRTEAIVDGYLYRTSGKLIFPFVRSIRCVRKWQRLECSTQQLTWGSTGGT